MTQQQELFREQPICPGCGSNNVATENPTTGKCRRCGWRLKIEPDGSATSWLKIGSTNGLPKRGRRSKLGIRWVPPG